MNYKQKFFEIYKYKNLPSEEINDEIDFVIELLTGCKAKDFIMGKTLTAEEENKIIKVLRERVETNKPIQYITGEAYFAGRKYYVNEYTLIPRPETEFLVQECVRLNTKENPEILDIGTGSGCIAIELALRLPKAQITACDIRQQVVDIAVKNADRYGVSDRIKFVKSDVFQNISEKFDIIVSNPPYIDLKDKNEVQQEVFDFEPHTALFAEDNGLFFYKKITAESKNFLNSDGRLIFEIGWKQAETVENIMLQNGFVNIKFTEDLDGIKRVISGIKTN